jgi:hypothetical protein
MKIKCMVVKEGGVDTMKKIIVSLVVLLIFSLNAGGSFSAETCIPSVSIDPSSIAVGRGWAVNFSASTTCGGDTIPGIYEWSVETNIGSTINDNGEYTAGNAKGIDTVTVVDTLNENVHATAQVEVWVCTPMQEALDALESDDVVTITRVEVEEWEEDSNFYYVFEPNGIDPTIGFIIYPGAIADPRAYAPAARTVAEKGYLAVSVKMIKDLALGKSAKRATTIIDTYSEITTWVIGGHSMGGAGASAYAKEFTDKISGVFYWASYPSELFRLDDTDLKVISIYGTKDGISTIDEIMASKEHLPPDAEFVPIEGGNHGQFAWCEGEPGENDIPDLTRAEQQSLINQATIGFLKNFEEDQCVVTFLLGRNHRQVSTLRQFRDKILRQTPEGQEIIQLYYEWSPTIVRAMEENEELTQEGKEMLDGVLGLIEKE